MTILEAIPCALRLVMATDGSTEPSHRRAVSAIALLHPTTGIIYSFAFPTPGVDQTYFAAELWALSTACILLEYYHLRATIFVDNSAVVRAATASTRLNASLIWGLRPRGQLRALAVQHQITWIPARDRHPEWPAFPRHVIRYDRTAISEGLRIISAATITVLENAVKS